MGKSPRRPEGLDAEAVATVAASIARTEPTPTERRRWRDLFELSVWMSEKAAMGKHVRLTPATATVVASRLAAAAAKPTRDEVALMICRQGEKGRCISPCYDCLGRANIVVAAYGCRLDDRRPADISG